MKVLGVDFGASGIKGAIVDVQKGEIVSQRIRLPTTKKSKPNDVVKVIKEIVASFQWKGIIGLGFPAIIKNGIACNAANISKKWIGVDVRALIQDNLGCQVSVVNDADAAGLAEMTFGAGKEYHKGVVLLLTLGTGVGSAVFLDGKLLPNVEFGHLEIGGKEAEHRASDAIRRDKNLSWKSWAKRLQEVLNIMEMLINPDVIIVGGGVSKHYQEYFPLLRTNAKIIPAHFFNQAGIIGAAVYANQHIQKNKVIKKIG